MIKYYYISPDKKIQACGPQREAYHDKANARILVIDGIPIAQQRPRATIRGKGKKKFVHMYTVNSKHKKKLQSLLVQNPIFEEATFIYALALYTPPKSWSGAKKERSYGKRKLTKPDGTNILKFYEDLLEGYLFPRDQYANPTMCERFYATKNKIVFSAMVSDELTYNLPRLLKQYFLETMFIK